MYNMRIGWLGLVAVGLFSLTLATTRIARADSKSCITSHATGQREAKAGHLRLATQLFTKCGSDESCPSRLRQECAELLQAVQLTVPTVIFSVVDEKNHDIAAAKVYSTDELIADGLDGRAIQIDPGKYRLRFLLPGGEVLNSDVLIREGEKNRLVQVRVNGEEPPSSEPAVKEPTGAAQPQATTTPLQPSQAASPSTPVAHAGPPVAAWVAAGTAVVALGFGTTFALLGKSKKSDVDACSPYCGSDARHSYDALKRDYLIADVAFAVGVVSAGVATWLFVKPNSESAGTTSDSAKPASVKVRPVAAALPGGGAIAVLGSF